MAPSRFVPGQNIGLYRLIRRLGSGGFGEVWLAERTSNLMARQVALKLPFDPDIGLVRQEAQTWLRASGHPNILPVWDADLDDNGQVYIASEYVDGGTLTDWLKRHGGKAPSLESAVQMMTHILKGLEHLHAVRPHPVIHRDLKPDNILLQGGIPRLTDFGIAKVLRTTSYTQHHSGTPPYMAPEVFSGKYNERTDLWAAGVIFYRLLTGALPFPQDDLMALMGAIVMGQPAALPASVPVNVKAVVERALQKDPAGRYASAGALRKEIEALLHAPSPSPVLRPQASRAPLRPVVPSGPNKPASPDGAEMIWIPAGGFQMGGNGPYDGKPIHEVTLSGFWMYRTPVTVAQFRQYDALHGKKYDWNGREPFWGWLDDHPMVMVTWAEAAAYAKWAGGALPTEAQWEYAARGGLAGKNYPWGDDWEWGKCANSVVQNSLKGTKPAGSYAPNGYGLYDMVGNVWEWCLDWYSRDYYTTPAARGPNPTGPGTGTSRVLRGGGVGLGP